MTTFLSAGIINETLEEICRQAARLKQWMDAGDTDKVSQGLADLEETALGLSIFMEKFSCQPLIYTGQGSTDEIIRRLEWALTFIEEFDPNMFAKTSRTRKKRLR